MGGVGWIPRIGEEFAGYRLVALIGHGGMSIVYRAEHIGLGRTVALKLLSPELSGDASFRERFERESRIAAGLEHPNVIPIYEAGEQDGVLYIAMRYVEGSDLKTRLRRDGPLQSEQAASLVAQVAAALEAAHHRELVHRDVKPANILVADDAGVGGTAHIYLSDFGVAKSSSGSGLTRTGLFVGTADYASPEQIEGKQLDGRADVYSLGCVAYEVLTAAPVYEKDSEVAMMYAHLLEPPPKVTDKRPDLPAKVDDTIAKAAAKSRDDRYSTATGFAAAFKDALGPASPAATPPAPAGAAETVLATSPPARTAAEAGGAAALTDGGRGRPGRISRRAWLIAAVVAVLAGIAILLGVLLSGGKSSSSAGGAPATTTGTTTVAGATAAANLLAVLVPTQIAKICKQAEQPSSGALETDACTSPPNAPVSDPNTFQLSFYPGSQALLAAYNDELSTAKSGGGLAKCGSNAAGVQFWVHPTGKLGGRRFCFIDKSGNYVVVWTHEKRGSDDHVDMLGTATEPGRAPTLFASWWTPLKDFIGKCRPLVGQEACLDTIEKITGQR
ncbi:MAG TPA: serine/threonine-protein kinase [Gaiellaceae bacterium]|nr:serine/threonine-protein kinase [Gaiellaceae bacterium]